MAKLAQIIFLMASIIMAATIVRAYNVLLGVCLGLSGDNLPPPWKMVQLCKKYSIRRIRLDEPNIDVLNAFRGAEIDLSFGIPNDMLTDMATNKALVEEWFNTYIKPFVNEFKINYVIVGDKAIPGLDICILPVMMSFQDLLNANYIGQVKLTTLVGYNAALAYKDPPSSGAFHPTISENMRGILKFLSEEGSPLMVSVFPYRKYMFDGGISLNYAIFNETEPVVRDGELNYYNLFDAMVEAVYAAIDKEAVGDVTVVVGETGWPTCGSDDDATPAIAEEYNKKFVSHICSGKGTPRKPNVFLEGFIQSIFNEDEKPQGDSQCYGMFDINMNPIYSLSLVQ
ncbi:probable glucan endo-1,3-beta-glucosidase BG5 [Benincasa hispida]|uniref:probable glucan endo-1,3-beta-glucosidase BG5 n=1 Tax=Benincasa hispida TaxID=102211 RepID=UPI0019023B91|nr:probable glucan endo-1,3-beta-glucosidase BG5 [Benincasa hispida]